jgi:serine/threonine protein kinase
MSTYTSEPGTRLAGRYRLEDQVDAGGGWALWKAIDEILARAVTVLMFTETFPRVREAVTAARAASRMNDSRLSQVFDVDDSGDRAYIVMEWVAGESLADMLSAGPLDPSWAATLVAEAAQAISAAHAAGLAHLRLVPGSLRWTSGGGVKITGLGMDAAIAGVGTEEDSPEERVLTDTRHLAWLMYAAVTGYWPGPETTALPPAPMVDGAPCTPRQVSAGVPANIDSIICRALFQRHGRDGSVITTPIAFADALTRVAPRALPTPSPFEDTGRMGRASETARIARYGNQQAPRPEAPGHARQGPPERRAGGYRGGASRPPRSGAAKALISLVLVLILAAAATVAWSVFHTKQSAPPRAAGSHSTSASPSAPATAILKPVSAIAADNNPQAGAAIDTSPSTDWSSQFYIGNPVFGGLRKGSGLILDMGRPVRLSQLQVLFGSTCCAAVHIEIGNSADPSSETGFTTVASASSAKLITTFNVTSAARGRYVMIWFTSLPPMAGSPNQYEAQVYNVVVRGSS